MAEQTSKTSRIKTPTVLQMEAVECGAASLAIILGYYERNVPLEELRVLCGVSRDGAKASNVVKAARSYGLEAKGYRKEPADLRAMKLPMIVFWNFNHFLVVEGFSKDGRVYLNDPAVGPRTVSAEEFDQSFTGVVLEFSPGSDFKPGGEKPTIFKALQRRLPGSEVALVYIILAGLALVIPGLIVPAFIRIFVDVILVQGNDNWLIPLAGGMVITLLLNILLTWLREFYLLRLETKLALTTSSKFFWHILRLPIEFFTQRYAGDIGSRVAINNKIATLLSGELATTIISIMTVIFYIGLMLQYSVLLTVVGIVVVALNLLALHLVSSRRIDINRKLLQESGKLIGTAMGGLQNIENLKASGTESDFFARWAGYQAKVVNSQQELAIYTELLVTVPPLLTALNTTLILSIGALQVIQGTLTMGMLIAFQSLMMNFVAPFNKLVDLGGVLQEVEADLNRLDDVLRYQMDKPFLPKTLIELDHDDHDNLLAHKLIGQVELDKVTFGYNRLMPPLIENLSLTIKPGQRVALVGGSGSGKSTVARLVAGLYEPWSGEILFDGKARPDIPRQILNNSLAVVDQEVFLFAGTIRDNLTMWDTFIPEMNMVQASKDADIHEVISARAEGYDGPMQEGGRNFSGGQRQRMEIARALVTNPSILILDEATSALDALTEQTIDHHLRRRGCTCLIVAHRLSTIRDCDEIIVLDQGKVVQRGTHDRMFRQKDSPYVKLIQAEVTQEEQEEPQSKSLLEMLY